MKELLIILKTSGEPDPMNIGDQETKVPNGVRTLAWKFTDENGNSYGSYYVTPEDTDEETLGVLTTLAIEQANETERALNEKQE